MRFRNIKKQTKEEKKVKPKYLYAFFSQRIKALITDMFMIYMPIMYVITYLVLGGKDELQNTQLGPLIAVSLYGLIYAILVSKYDTV